MVVNVSTPLPVRCYLFDTALGVFGIAWSERGLCRLQRPEADREAIRQRLGTAIAEEPPAWVEQTIGKIRRYLTGERVDFAALALDLTEVGDFRHAVYGAARAVGWGRTASYSELARRIGFPWGARAVGQALARNPTPIIVPCHRILTHDRRIGGFSAYGGTLTKQRLLALERVELGAPTLPGLAGPPPSQSDLARRDRAP